jgi:hypothetical protein
MSEQRIIADFSDYEEWSKVRVSIRVLQRIQPLTGIHIIWVNL